MWRSRAMRISENVYAIALGIADGLQERHGHPFHDLKAAVFTQSVHDSA
jgi:glycerol-3-phosphate dehydrogenase (NAD(P)+)